jgi:hemerythrin-like metal-binding protein
MALIAWDQSFSVKVEQCDEDHKRLFAVINKLHDAMVTGKGSQIISQILKELEDYTKFHFSREESLLEKTNYPALAPHRAQHREFENKVEHFKQELEAGKTQSVNVANFLKDWLTNHIKQTDRQYSDHLNAEGVH